jgi:uncharacterized Tic20 family protein
MIITGFVAPLIIWAVFKDRSRLVGANAAAATNFGFLVTIAYAVSSLLAVTVILSFLTPIIAAVVWIAALVFGIIGALQANKGEVYPYPVNVKWIK